MQTNAAYTLGSKVKYLNFPFVLLFFVLIAHKNVSLIIWVKSWIFEKSQYLVGPSSAFMTALHLAAWTPQVNEKPADSWYPRLIWWSVLWCHRFLGLLSLQHVECGWDQVTVEDGSFNTNTSELCRVDRGVLAVMDFYITFGLTTHLNKCRIEVFQLFWPYCSSRVKKSQWSWKKKTTFCCATWNWYLCWP